MPNLVKYKKQEVAERAKPKSLTRWQRWKTGLSAPFRASRDKEWNPKELEARMILLVKHGVRRPKAEIALTNIRAGHVTKEELRGLASGTPTQIMEGIRILARIAHEQEDSILPEPYRNPGARIVVEDKDLKMLAERLFKKIRFKRVVEMNVGATTLASTVFLAIACGVGADVVVALASLGGLTTGGSYLARKKQLREMAEELMNLNLTYEVKKAAARLISDGKARAMLPATIDRGLRIELEKALTPSKNADNAYQILLSGKMPSEEGQYHLMKVVCDEGTVWQVQRLVKGGHVTSEDAIAIARQRIAGDFAGFRLLPEKCGS